MKKIVTLLFIFAVIKLNAQKQYKCYHVQEFMWNAQTKKFDTPIEKTDASVFEMNSQKKLFSQTFEDGGSKSFSVNSETVNKEQNTVTYKVISPSDGYTYVYKINSKLLVIEFSQEKAGDEILLKKYLYKE